MHGNAKRRHVARIIAVESDSLTGGRQTIGAEQVAQRGKGLAKALPCLFVETLAPEQVGKPVARLRPVGVAGEIGEERPAFRAANRDLLPAAAKRELAQQAKLAAVDFQSRARPPAELDIKHPILPKALARGEAEAAGSSAGGRDSGTLTAAYYPMIKLIDDQLGRVLDRLEELGLRERTVVIFTSDHGEMLGDHGLIQKGCRFYEGLVRVPLTNSASQLPASASAVLTSGQLPRDAWKGITRGPRLPTLL